MLQDAAGQLTFRVARGLDQQTIATPAFEVSRSVLERVVATRQPMLASDARSDVRLNLRQSVMLLGLRSILCVPLLLKAQLTGLIYVDNRLQAGIFSPADLELLTAIAASAAIAIENARLYQLALAQGRLERELQVARQVQARLLPRATPEVPGWEFAARWQPALEVAGDYYDFVSLPGGRLGVVIADVTDKGMPAALFMALTRSTVRGTLAHAASPAEALASANRLLCADAANGMFVTLCCVALDPATGVAHVVNAGHNPPLWYRAAGDDLTALPFGRMPLGVESDMTYPICEVALLPGDFLLLYTDGLTDALNPAGEDFGPARLRAALTAHRRAPAQRLLAGVVDEALAGFAGSAAPFDDVTLVAMRRSTDQANQPR
jgi:sigma-B regulation protein RsbU (phosphoserine phosphatase)